MRRREISYLRHIETYVVYVAALSEMVARPMARGLPLQLLKMPPSARSGTRRTGASPAHAWLRAVVEEIGRATR